MNKHVKKLKSVFTTPRSLVWSIITVIIIALLIVVTVLANGLYEPALKTVLGGPKPIMGDNALNIYTSDYNSKAESVAAGNELNIKICEEGFTLCLNEEINGVPALPIKTSKDKKAKVTVFGHNSVKLVLGGSGSGGGVSGVGASLYDGLEAGNFEYNPTIKKFYDSNAAGDGRTETALSDSTDKSPTLKIGETPLANYTQEVINSFDEYGDAAIVVISRVGGESFDVPRTQSDDKTRHYLQLDKNEYDMLDLVTSYFDKVIVVLNTLSSFQCDFIEEYNNTPNDPRIDAVLWIGGPGPTGAKALGGILNGDINPSGKTVDIYSKDFTKDPTWANFGDGSQSTKDGSQNTSFMLNQTASISGYNMLTYEEGMYVGYRYYETRGYEETANGNGQWYDDNVIFPFGYGLSYTAFNQEIISVEGGLDESKGEKVTVTIRVTNTGEVSGKDVVQLYVGRPYTIYCIEKPYVTLVDYAKTKSLATGASEEVSFTIEPYDLASYDCYDQNSNGFSGYELEKGEYIFYAGRSSHVDGADNAVAGGAYDSKSIPLDIGGSITWSSDPDSDYKVVNLYTGVGYDSIDYKLETVTVNSEERRGMSRTDFEGTFPKAFTVAERIVSDEQLSGWNTTEISEGVSELEKLKSKAHNNPTVADVAMPTTGANVLYKLRDLVDKNGYVDYKDDKWSALLDSLTFEEMKALVNNGAFQTIAIESIGKNLTNDSDGPIGFVNFMPGKSESYKDNATFACEIVIGSTWNKDLAYQMGKIVGENGLWGDTGTGLSYSGWYAPAVNLHRSPFSGRNFEYYSEDPVLSGKLAVNVINGAAKKGVYTDLKHFAVNDQETNRSGVSTFMTEQVLREIYLKPFEIAVKAKDSPKYSATASADGVVTYKGTTGIMTSFNRIGNTWTGGDYRLLTEILRNEWGFKGLVICDYKTDNFFMDAKQMLYAGNDLILASVTDLMWTTPDANSAQDVYILRQASHHILYTVANSNAIQADIIGYSMEWWKVLIIALDIIIPIGLAVWGFFAIRSSIKKFKKEMYINKLPPT